MANDALTFIRSCITEGKAFWTYHVNMRLQGRCIAREQILAAVDTFEIIEDYPDDKYLPSCLVWAKAGNDIIHIHVALDRKRSASPAPFRRGVKERNELRFIPIREAPPCGRGASQRRNQCENYYRLQTDAGQVGSRFQKKEKEMKCRRCGAEMEHVDTNLPFKVRESSIVIIKDLPVWQCGNCSEYLIEDGVMAKVDILLGRVDASVEVEILSYAA
jgi:YgiT-type zinc finger domain-containing protein